MKKLLLILIAVILIIPLCSFIYVPTHSFKYSQDVNSKVIVCIGDSLTQRDVYPQKLRDLLGADWQVINKGISGERTDQMLTRFYNDAIVPNPYAVIIWGGTNDYQWSNPYDKTENALYQMYEMAYNAGVKIVALNISPRGGYRVNAEPWMSYVNSWISNAPFVDYFIDDYSILQDPERSGYLLPIYDDGDGLHLSQDGFNAVGELIYKVMFVDPVPVSHPIGSFIAFPPVPPPAPAPEPENGGGVYYYTPNDIGNTGLNFGGLTVDYQGNVIYDKTISSLRGEVELTVNSGTVALDINGNPLHIIRIDETTENISGNIVKVYDLKPQGANFSQNCTLKFNYIPSDNITQVVSWNGTGWQVLESTANPKIKVVICNITHFSKYALIEMEAPKIAEITLTPEQTRYMEFLKLCFSFSMNSYFIPFFK